MSKEEKWAANIAFVGSKEKVKEILKMIEKLEEQGELEDYTGIEGPYDSLQLMLKRRNENLALEVGVNNTQGQLNVTGDSSQIDADS
ncbi:hypothetical protein [Pseudogulbenkiania subflava]|uniref:Uncharacterized protein n=1 Tax=Pseudogulbenkiania subflava DSM 22618 TaxID=1123014 RepID=A0A1Y6BPC9_9NEIS|nr:hypothetical protein [Pseudogulbenkiania subflava]SMF22312.1 hypothetical protein SAMN02745746_01964 [Pseudogulbenkiania subflava DSM 22618]